MNAKELGGQPVSLTMLLGSNVDPQEIVSALKAVRTLTKRELFAAMAMQGLLSDNDNASDIYELGFGAAIATAAIHAADELLAGLAKDQP